MRKKLQLTGTFLLLMMFGFVNVVTAQNLALNPSFESWTTNGAPGPADDWALSGTSMTGAQETVNVRTGAYSTNITWTTTSTRQLEQYIAINGSSNYEFSFWVLDNDPNGRARVAIRWYDSGGDLTGTQYYGGYSTDLPTWQELTSGSQTAPADAVEAHIEIRVYDVSWSGTATVYVDDVLFEENTTLEISSAYAVSETAVDVLYSAAIASVNATDYSLTGSTAITFSGATIDGTNPSLVHLTGASVNMASDITLDNITDAANADNFDFYAGIMSCAFVNTTNPGGTMSNGEIATFQGVVSANDAYNNVWYSDATGAYNGVLVYSSSFDGLVAVGDEILFTADRTVYNDLTELEYPTLISTISTGNTPYGPSLINGSDIDENNASDTDPGESWEGQFVKIENFTVDSYDGTTYSYRCSWSDGANTFYFYVGDNVDYHLGSITLNVGETYTEILGVVDWLNAGPYFRINPRDQSDVVGAGPAEARIVGSMNGWSTSDPNYVMSMNANGLYELTKSLDAGDHEYKVIEGDAWTDPNYPDNNQHVILTATEDVTWKTNTTADLVTHMNPVVAGSFLSAIGGIDWDPTELMGEMTDPDGDDIFELVLTIPAGTYEGKVTLNQNWDQSTGGNVTFETDGVTPTTFTYDFPNNTTTISGPAPPTAPITFIVNDATNMNYDGFFLKGSWDGNGQYDPSWGSGMEHSEFYDDGTNGDAVAGDHIWTCQQDLVVDGGSNTWEWGVNDTESNWVAGNWQFTIPDQTAQTLTWMVPDVVDLVINEIMYNSPDADEEWIELYNNTDQTIDLENWDVCDNDASHTHIIIPAGYSVGPGEFFTISIETDGAFPFTPDYDGTGNFALNNSGDGVRVWNPSHILVDVVNYDDSDPWPTSPDGDGPSLSLIDPDTDNSLAESWLASIQDGGTPGSENFPPIPYVTISNPNGGEFISQGDAYDITWVFDFWTGDIDIKLVKDGYSPIVIGSDIAVADGIWTWNVSEAIQLGDDYKIMIVPVDPIDPSDESDDFFSIIEPYVMPEIVITEIMYNPPEVDNDSLEFLELYNNGDETVDLEGFHFTEGIEYIFPSVDLAPDNYLLVAVNSNAMMNTFGVDAMQWTDGGLSNGGEDIELQDSFNNVIDFVLYDDHLPWDTLADGYGPSLTLCNPDVDNSIAENWTHSINLAAINTNGDSIWATPGFGCVAELLPGFVADVTSIEVGGSVLFTDLTIGDPIEWIWSFEGGTPETWNGQTPPDIYYNDEGMWDVILYVSDGANSAEVTYTDYIEVIYIPDPFVTISEPNGGEFISQGEPYDITWVSDFWTGDIDIKLVKGVDTPVLLGSNISVEDGSWMWNVSITEQLGDDFKIMIVPVNPDDPSDESDGYFSIIEPYVAPEIVITEIMYNPPESGTDSLEFLELYNNGDEIVNLEGFYFAEGVEYIFPNIDIDPDSYLLVAVSSSSMLNTFGVDALQWTSGGLSNGGEDIELRDSYDNVIDSLTYDDALPWDPLADGNGPSLTLCNPSVDNSIAVNWTHSVNFAALNAAGDSIWATPGFGCEVELLPGFTANTISIVVGDYVTFTDLTLGDPIDWKWTFEGGTPEIVFGQYPPEIYYDEVGTWDVTLFVYDGVTTAEIIYENYIEVIDLPAPANLEAEVGPYDDVQLTWSVPSTTAQIQMGVTAELLGYNVYRDNDKINAVVVEVAEYNDPEPTIGSHDYFVTAVYDSGESDPSNIVSIVVTDINNVVANSVKLYPNPTEGIFTVEYVGEVTVDISIIDITGKEVYNNKVNKTSQVNISYLGKGLYFVRLLDDSSKTILTKKLIVR